MSRILLIPVLLTACAPRVTEENAATLYGDAFCSKLRQCDRGRYDDTYDNFPDCVEDIEDAAQNAINLLGIVGLDLDLEEAQSCLVDLRRATCEEWENGSYSNDCDDIFSF